MIQLYGSHAVYLTNYCRSKVALDLDFSGRLRKKDTKIDMQIMHV